MTTVDPGLVGEPDRTLEGRAYAVAFAQPGLAGMVGSDIRWAFARPLYWLSGIAFNLALSLLYLVFVPLTGGQHRDWAILVGTYFAVFVLADVTTTNVLGVDTARVRLHLLRGVPLLRLLVAKNLALLVIVGMPTLLATAVITLHSEPSFRLELTLPGVLYPVLTWLGVGNLVSVCLPYFPETLRRRWRERHQVARTVRWLFCLVLPYALCVAVDPLSKLPRLLTRALHLRGTTSLHGMLVLGLGTVLWTLATAAATTVARHVKIPFDDLR